ncbi:hypothetical protein SAMN04487948_10373 [Halogranum amylolyticum]|uniref:Uncharacterized protein n=1 Tax=Halogranum amylolyticum TaxID=660520 RepID=A0A1H8QEZ9_9EURY|nr:hypothetical protein [Halogranum amylolyticum]SEO52571.1 hypothetical protein SAMN04487948_10373 [Halogranum amylolyticum]
MTNQDSPDHLNRLKEWYLLTGSRTRLAGIVLFSLLVVTGVLVETGVMYVGPGSSMLSLLASGMLSGLLSLITVSLSINQLILSRVFGSPSGLTDRLEGNLEFRRNIEEVTGVRTSPNDPASFLGLVAETLERRAANLERTIDDSEADYADEFAEYTQELVSYGQHLGQVREGDETFKVLDIMIGSRYAYHMDRVRELRSMYGNHISKGSDDDLEAIFELLKAVATIRQFFKTIAIQQDLAMLSRRIIYTGVLAVVTNYALTTVYTSSSGVPTTISPAHLPLVVTLATPILFAPLVILVSYLLRVATIALYTASVGSFVPPEEQITTSSD